MVMFDEMRCSDGPRMTGRTTRMVEQAVSAVKAGESVLILAATRSHAASISNQVYYRMVTKRVPVSLFAIRITVKEIPEGFLPEMAKPIGYGGYLVFVDHYAIERQYWRLLEELHRFDRSPTYTAGCVSSDLGDSCAVEVQQ